jgi:hypothetical protein
MFVTETVIHERRVEPGDLVFMVGLFTRMTGKRKPSCRRKCKERKLLWD